MPEEIDFADPKASPIYEEWKAKGILLAGLLSSLYDDKVTIHFNDTPSEAKFILTIGVHTDTQVVKLLDFAKEQGII